MAELAISIVGLVLAAPGTAIAFAECGEKIQMLAYKFKHAPQIVQEIGAFGHDLHQGKLKLNLQLVEWAFSCDDIDQLVKDSLEDHLSQLRSKLLSTAAILERLFDKRGEVRRTYFVLLGEKRVVRAVNELRKWQNDFLGIIDLIDRKRRLVPENLVLSRQRFKLRRTIDGQEYTPLAAGSHIVLARGEYLNGTVHEIDVLIERRRLEHSSDSDEMKAVASYLAGCLYNQSSNRGILQCLGYREDQGFELVFKIPETLTKPQTLQSTVSTKTDKICGGYALDDRFRLCRELCEAVFSVHNSGLVHKNIRPETILLFKRTPGYADQSFLSSLSSPAFMSTKRSTHQPQLGSPFLTDWSMLRKVSGLSSRRGGNDWMKDIYRHPSRQGLQPQDRYNIGHDIYSIGIALLEVGIWECFIQKERDPAISERYQEMALKLKFVNEAESNSIKKLTMPLVVQKVMVTLAEEELPPRMGSHFARFVVACLTCLEGGFGDIGDFKNNSSAAAVRFHERVVQTFSNICY